LIALDERVVVAGKPRSERTIDLRELTVTRADVQPTITSLAADESLDMLVMGAYGHSRIRERLLGGVTREMLRTMTVPTLISHFSGGRDARSPDHDNYDNASRPRDLLG
jgi:nucleotide-binding universal stress UspA family protein